MIFVWVSFGFCILTRRSCFLDFLVQMLRSIESVVAGEKLGYMLIDGATPSSERFESVARFQSDDSCRVAILSLLAASQGITLTAADTVVFAELHWTPGIIEQAENRAHRIGQKSSVSPRLYLFLCHRIPCDVLRGCPNYCERVA